MFEETDKRWKRVTVEEALVLSAKGWLVWWRQNGSINKEHPEKDICRAMEVQ